MIDIFKTIIFAAIFWAHSLSAQPNHLINFEIEGFEDSVTYIGYHFGTQKYILDTLDVASGSFQLRQTEVKPGIYFIYTPNYYFEFIMEPGDYSLKTTVSGGYSDLKVKGSLENEVFKEFQLEMMAIQKKQRMKIDSLKQLSGEDSIALVSSIKQLNQKMETKRNEIIEQNPNTFVASFLKLISDLKVPKMDSIADESANSIARYNYYQRHFFEEGLLEDKRLLRTPVFHAKVMKYFDQVLIQQPDTIIQHIDDFMAKVGDDPESFRYWLVTFFKKYTESKVMGMDAVMVHLIEKYYLTGRVDWISEEYEKKLREEVAYVKPNLIGKTAPPIVVQDTLMQQVSLHQVQAEYTLLFIYDPDCGHCKKAVKKLEELDNEMANAGIQIFALCTTTDVDRWKEFVSEHNPTWLHAIDPSGKNYFRVLYNVRTTPQIYLLDEHKKIIAKKLEINQFLNLVQQRNRQQ